MQNLFVLLYLAFSFVYIIHLVSSVKSHSTTTSQGPFLFTTQLKKNKNKRKKKKKRNRPFWNNYVCSRDQRQEVPGSVMTGLVCQGYFSLIHGHFTMTMMLMLIFYSRHFFATFTYGLGNVLASVQPFKLTITKMCDKSFVH